MSSQDAAIKLDCNHASHNDEIDEFHDKDDDFEQDFQSPYPELEGDDLGESSKSSNKGPVLLNIEETDDLDSDGVLSFDEVDDKPEISEERSKSNTDNKTLTHRSSRKNKVATCIALLLGAGALALSGYSHLQNSSQETFLVQVSDTLTTLISSDATLLSKIEQLDTTTREMVERSVIAQRTESIKLKDAIDIQMSELTRAFTNQEQLSSKQESDLAFLQSNVMEVQQSLNRLTSDLESTASTIESMRTIAKPSTAPSINFANSLEGATLESIDRWGNEVFVNLRTAEGNWMSFTDRDSFKGWAVINIEQYQVTFAKNGQKKVLKLRD